MIWMKSRPAKAWKNPPIWKPSFPTQSPAAPLPPSASTSQQLHDASASYQLAIVQRQRLGNNAARQPPDGKARQIVYTSPAPELRFRTQSGLKRQAEERVFA